MGSSDVSTGDAQHAQQGALAATVSIPLAERIPAPEACPPVPPTVEQVLIALASMSPRRTYPTRFQRLNELLDGGLVSRTLLVIAAPPGSGKTALAGTQARDLAVTLAESLPVLFCSTEIEGEEQAARLAAAELSVKPGDILAHRTSPAIAAAAVKGWPVYLLDLDGYDQMDAIGVIQARAEVIRQMAGRTPAIIVDYIQQLAADEIERRRISVGTTTNRLRRLARHLDVPVVGISSVSRAYYGPSRKAADAEEDPRAWLAAGKESGDIEFAAAAFLYLDTSSAADANGYSSARLIVAKSRGGRVGFVGLRFHGPTGTWTEHVDALADLGAMRRNRDEDEKVLATSRLRAAQRGPAFVKDELRRSVQGVGARRIDAALKRLINAGEVLVDKEERLNARQQMRKVDVIHLAGETEARSASAGPLGVEGADGEF